MRLLVRHSAHTRRVVDSDVHDLDKSSEALDDRTFIALCY